MRCQLVLIEATDPPGIGACLLGNYSDQKDVVDCLVENTAPLDGLQINVHLEQRTGWRLCGALSGGFQADKKCKVVVVKKKLLTFIGEAAGDPPPPYNGYFDFVRTTQYIALLRLWIDRRDGVFAKATEVEALARTIDALEETSRERAAMTANRLSAIESLLCRVFRADAEPVHFESVD